MAGRLDVGLAVGRKARGVSSVFIGLSLPSNFWIGEMGVVLVLRGWMGGFRGENCCGSHMQVGVGVGVGVDFYGFLNWIGLGIFCNVALVRFGHCTCRWTFGSVQEKLTGNDFFFFLFTETIQLQVEFYCRKK